MDLQASEGPSRWIGLLCCLVTWACNFLTAYLHCELLCSCHLHMVVGSLLEAHEILRFRLGLLPFQAHAFVTLQDVASCLLQLLDRIDETLT